MSNGLVLWEKSLQDGETAEASLTKMADNGLMLWQFCIYYGVILQAEVKARISAKSSLYLSVIRGSRCTPSAWGLSIPGMLVSLGIYTVKSNWNGNHRWNQPWSGSAKRDSEDGLSKGWESLLRSHRIVSRPGMSSWSVQHVSRPTWAQNCQHGRSGSEQVTLGSMQVLSTRAELPTNHELNDSQL